MNGVVSFQVYWVVFLIYRCGENAHFFSMGREAPRIFIFVFGWGNIYFFGLFLYLFLLVLFFGGL